MNYDSLLHCLQGKRLIFHAGTTKTGTSSLQHLLYNNRAILSELGILYPSHVSSSQLKHQWLIECLVRNNQQLLDQACTKLKAELSDHIHTVFLSTEGLYNHFYDYSQSSHASLEILCREIDVQVVVVFRNPLEYSIASYKQGLINPTNSWSPYYGHTKSLEEVCNDSKWLQRLNYEDFVLTWRKLAGLQSVHCFPYSRGILRIICNHILNFDIPADYPIPMANPSVESLGVELLHVLNRHQVPMERRSLAIQHIRSIDDLVPAKFTHSSLTQACIEKHCTASLLRLTASTPQISNTVGAYLRTLPLMAAQIPPEVNTRDIAFLLCIEAGFIEEQSILLVQSLRLFGGVFASCPVYLICPRPNRAPSAEIKKILALMDATVIVEDLNQALDHFPYANKAYALAHLEQQIQSSFVVFLDSDTLFLDEPCSLAIAGTYDFAARPVDVRGICCGPHDADYKGYWTDLCELAGISIDALPLMQSGVTREAIHANYNGGLLVVRRSLGIGRRWQELLEQAWQRGICPRPRNFWGSGQSTFAVAAHAISSRGHVLPDCYNIPLHSPAPGCDYPLPDHPKHAHYHWLLETDHFQLGQKQLLSLNLSDNCRTFVQALNPFSSQRGISHTGFSVGPPATA